MSDTLSGIEKEFHSAVDDYLEFCDEVGKEPARSTHEPEIIQA